MAAASPVAGGDALLATRAFPQLDRHNRLPSDKWRAWYFALTNNRLAFAAANWRYIAAARRLDAPELTPAGARVAEDLSANGIAFAAFSDFFQPAFFETLTGCFQQYLDAFRRAQSGARPKGKAVFLDTIHKAHTFVADEPVSSYLGAPIFAAIAARYLRMVPRFVGSSFWRNRAVTGADRLYSQQWHRDYNDRRLMKVFLYLTDVGRDEGYFEYIAGSHGRGALGGTYDRIGSDGFRAYPDADTVDRHVGTLPVFELQTVSSDARTGPAAPWHRRPAVLRCLAPKATLIFADTFGLHRGGYVHAGHRDMIMATYSTNFNVHKPHFSVTRGFADRLTPFMRMAFGLS